MKLAIYSLVVSLAYGAIAVLLPAVGEALTVAFVALLLLPSIAHDLRGGGRDA